MWKDTYKNNWKFTKNLEKVGSFLGWYFEGNISLRDAYRKYFYIQPIFKILDVLKRYVSESFISALLGTYRKTGVPPDRDTYREFCENDIL